MVLASQDGKIVCENTLDSRLELVFRQKLPEVYIYSPHKETEYIILLIENPSRIFCGTSFRLTSHGFGRPPADKEAARREVNRLTSALHVPPRSPPPPPPHFNWRRLIPQLQHASTLPLRLSFHNSSKNAAPESQTP